MGVYINMEMPKNCGGCKFFAWKRGVGQYCAVDDRITFHATIDGMDVAYERNGNCPLVPVPPHGRLIEEADAIETAWLILRGLGYFKEENPQLEQTVHEVFATAPTIEVE